jgi:hypothetical protein
MRQRYLDKCRSSLTNLSIFLLQVVEISRNLLFVLHDFTTDFIPKFVVCPVQRGCDLLDFVPKVVVCSAQCGCKLMDFVSKFVICLSQGYPQLLKFKFNLGPIQTKRNLVQAVTIPNQSNPKSRQFRNNLSQPNDNPKSKPHSIHV